MTDGMSLGRQQASQLAGTLTGPPERGHRIAPSIRVNQSFQRLDQLGVVLDQSLPSGSGVPYSLNGERWFSKALDSSIDGRTRESGNTGDAGNTSSSQLLCIDGSDKVLLPLIQVRKQQAVFLLEFFCCAHTDSVTHRASCVTIIILRALSNAELVIAGGSSGIPSLARSVLVRRKCPVAVVMDSDSVDPDVIEERQQSTEDLIRAADASIPVKVIAAIPEIEAWFLASPETIERMVGQKVSEEWLYFGRRDPRGALTRLAKENKKSWDINQAISALDDQDIQRIRAIPEVAELSAFLQETQQNH